MDAEKLADKARNSISSYCINECKSFCCRKGYLPLIKEQVDKVTKGKSTELEEKGELYELEDGNFSLKLSNHLGGCPSLKDFKCTIYKDKKRPRVCHEFPIFVKEKRVFFSPRCLAVMNNKFFPYVKKFKSMGYEVFEESPYSNPDWFQTDFSKNGKK